MQLSLLTPELAHRIEYSDYEVMSGRMQAIMNRAGNPFEVEFAKFGEATAISAKNLPRDFNKLWGFGPSEIHQLNEILRHYDSRNPDFAIDLIPSQFDTITADALQALGFFQYGFHTAFYTEPITLSPPVPESVRVVKCNKNQAGVFSEMFHLSLELPADIAENEESFNFLLGDPRWFMYIGFLEEIPVAFSMMFMSDDGVACFGMAGTLPEYRGRGMQSAMLTRRMSDARKHGCFMVTAQSEFGTSSFRNLLRAGFRIAYTKAVWKRISNNC